MCGRIDQDLKQQKFEARYGVTLPDGFVPVHNIKVGEGAAIVVNGGGFKSVMGVFGFSPSWAEKPMYLFNARSEGDNNQEDAPDYQGELGIFKKPSFRNVITSSRCLVPVTGFYEGSKTEKLKRPFHLTSDIEPIISFAGIWGNYVNKQTCEIKPTFSILTTAAIPPLQAVGHHRSPLMLHPDSETEWLDPQADLSDIEGIMRLRYYPDDLKGIELAASQLKQTSVYFDHWDYVQKNGLFG